MGPWNWLESKKKKTHHELHPPAYSFSLCMANKFEHAAANVLDPLYRGIHLKELEVGFNSYYDSTMNKLESLSNSLENGNDRKDNLENEEIVGSSISTSSMSPNSKLRLKYMKKSNFDESHLVSS